MANKWHIYKASGKVTYFVDDIMAPSKEKALEIASDCVGDDASFAAEKGNVKVLELKVEPLRHVTKREVIKVHGKEYWEDSEKETDEKAPEKDSSGAD